MLFQKTEKKVDFSKLNKLIYGFPKTGKTTLASYMHDKDGKPPLFITTEDGHGAMEIYQARVESWAGFKKLVKMIASKADQVRSEHSCIVIDLISDIDMMCTKSVCDQKRVEHLTDLDFGKGFHLQKVEFQREMQELFNVLPIVFICHSTEKEITYNNEKIKRQAPSLAKGALEYINGKVDVIMWIDPSNSKKKTTEIRIKPNTTCISGSRFKQLCQDFIFNPENPQEAYDAMQSAFVGKENK